MEFSEQGAGKAQDSRGHTACDTEGGGGAWGWPHTPRFLSEDPQGRAVNCSLGLEPLPSIPTEAREQLRKRLWFPNGCGSGPGGCHPPASQPPATPTGGREPQIPCGLTAGETTLPTRSSATDQLGCRPLLGLQAVLLVLRLICAEMFQNPGTFPSDTLCLQVYICPQSRPANSGEVPEAAKLLLKPFPEQTKKENRFCLSSSLQTILKIQSA